MVFCGIDIGTTNVKAILIDADGDIIARQCIANPTSHVEVFWYDYFETIMDRFQDGGFLNTDAIYCSIASQGGSFIFTDDKFNPLSSMLLWTDMQSGVPYLQKYISEYCQDEFYKITGWKPGGWLPIFKLRGLERQKNERISFIPDYIYGRLTGNFVTDITNAQISGLCDFRNRVWCDDLVDWAQIDKTVLPEICDTVRVLASDIKTRWGNLNIVSSSHDQYAAMNALSLELDKGLILSSGTAWVVNGRKSCPVYDMDSKVLHPGFDIGTGNYGNISTVGRCIGKSFNDMLYSYGITYARLDLLEAELKEVPLPDGMIDLADYDSSESLVVKRYMEWMAFLVKKHFIENGFNKGLEEIILTGGAANSGILPQVLSDVCGINVRAVVFPELTAYGAAKFAAQAVGVEFEKNVFDVVDSKSYYPSNCGHYEQWYDIQMSNSEVEYLCR